MVHHSGHLSGGTGTYNADNNTMDCGPFEQNDLPVIDSKYNLTGYYEGDNKFYTFDAFTCITSHPTSSFRR